MNNKPQARSVQRRKKIMKVALDMFLEHGFSATSMSAIASQVGGSKGTLYNYVKTKEELFQECVQQHIETQAAQVYRVVEESGSLRVTLLQYCTSLLKAITSKRDIALNRLVIAEAVRFPDIGRVYYETRRVEGAARLASYLAQKMAAGELRSSDPLAAARFLSLLCQGGSYQRCLLSLDVRPSAAQMAEEVRVAVDSFLAVYQI